jgi:hypothetical protein
VAHLQSEVPSPAGQDQLGHTLLISSLIALATMTIVSAALGWLVVGRVAPHQPDDRRRAAHLRRQPA